MLPVVCLLLCLSTAASAEPALKLPSYSRTKLPNGLVLLLMEQHEVPLASFSVLVRTGSTADPGGKEGLASVTADLLRRGTATRTADQIATELDFIGGTLEFEAGLDFIRGGAEFLKKDLNAGLDLLADVLLNPNFPAAEFEKLISQEIDTRKQEKDEPQAVIRPYFRALLFGDHPYSRPVRGDERSLAAIRHADAAAFYQRHFHPANLVLAVAGDFDRSEMERLLTAKFGAWRPHKTAAKPQVPPAPRPLQERKLLLVNKPDATQTFFILGSTGIERTHPDRVGIDVVNTVFGGRFTSMLNDALRVNSGLTYGARASFERTLAPGAFTISTYTKNATTVQAIDMALDVLRQLRERGISGEQLSSAKAYVKGQFAPHIETTDQLAAVMTELEFFGLDQREINQYFDRIDIFTAEDARRIIDAHYPKEALAFTLIGKAAEIRDAVKKYAPKLEEREITQAGFR